MTCSKMDNYAIFNAGYRIMIIVSTVTRCVRNTFMKTYVLAMQLSPRAQMYDFAY